MTIYNYIPGTARRLPLDYNLNILNTDYTGTTPLQDWADMVAGKELDVLTKGEILMVPKGILHEETATGTGIEINPVSDSADYFAGIICEDPADKAKLQIINNSMDVANRGGFTLYKNSKMYDCSVGITTSQDLNGMGAQLVTLDDNSLAVGITNNDILAQNTTGSGAGIFGLSGSSMIINCAFNNNNDLDVGAGLLFGAVFQNTTNTLYIYNTTFNGTDLGVVNNTTTTQQCVNVVLKNNSMMSFYEESGPINQTTCCDGCGLTFEADGYTLTASDGQGTDLSDDAVFAFTDDINGEAFVSGAWDRGADAYVSSSTASSAGLLHLGLGLRL